MVKIGIIGGSGLEDCGIIKDCKKSEIETPYGNPSSLITYGKIGEAEIYILSRHGEKHEIPPGKVNYRANIYALKKLGVQYVLATTACGSLREEIKRGDFVILDQFIDFTKHRIITFHEEFKEGPVHVSLAEPFSHFLREKMIECCDELQIPYHKKGTVITIEGNRFGTRAESNAFRQWGADVVNMSIAPEATLAREVELEYCAIAMSTDYDCWKIDEKPVSWDEILRIFGENAEKMKKLLVKGIEKIANNDEEFIKNKIRTIPDFPKAGIMFRDITTLLGDKEGFQRVIDVFYERYKNKQIDVVAGIESRGFTIGGALAYKLGAGLALVRKKGKLPFEKISQEYELEYGTDVVEMHKDAIKPGEKVLIVDDLVATAGTCLASCNLVNKVGGKIEECCFVIELEDLEGRKKLENKGYNMFSIVKFKENE